jgi:AcrR family transcriptional regulator
VRDGLDAFDVDTLAARMHCSRATIYRYAGGKAQIRDAVLMRLAARIIETVRHSVEGLSGPERIVKAITVAVEQIRSDPTRRLMISSMATGDLSDLPSSPVLGRLAADLTGLTDDDPLAAQWIVRVVLSLAYWPIGDSRFEHQMLQRFVSPAFSA